MATETQRASAMNVRDKLVLKLIRCLGPLSVKALAGRVRKMYPTVEKAQVVAETCESLEYLSQHGYAEHWKLGEIYVYDVTALGRNWFDRMCHS